MPRGAEPERSCALTREVKPAADLIRFVVGPDAVLVPDTEAKAEGRGVWISLSAAKVAEAVRKKAFARSLKAQVSVPEDLADLTRRRLEGRLIDGLKMARKAGQLLTGAFKVKAAIEAGEVIALITATDAARDGREKMASALAATARRAAEAGEKPAETPHFELLDSAQLGLALGLENVIHAALIRGAAAQSAVEKANRLARYIAG